MAARGRAAHVEAVRAQLSDRELALLASLGTVRLASGRQVQRLHFADTSPLAGARACRRTLERLTKLGVITRLDRQVGGVHRGSQSYLYALNTVGQRLVDHGGPAGGARHRQPWTPGSQFTHHALAVAEVFVAITEAERAGEHELIDFETEPACWRRFSDDDGGSFLKADAFVILGAGDYEHRCFVEVDLATESSAAIKRKVRVYRSYYSSGREQLETGMFPRVQWLVDNERRREVLARVFHHETDETRELHTVSRLDEAWWRAAARAGGLGR